MSFSRQSHVYRNPFSQGRMAMSETIKLASVLVNRFPSEAIKFITDCDQSAPGALTECVQAACEVGRLSFHAVMAEEEGHVSELPYRSTPVNRKGPPRSRHTSLPEKPIAPLSPPPSSQASSPVLTSQTSKQQSSPDGEEIICAFNADNERKMLNMTRASGSYHLISENIVSKRLRMAPQTLGGPIQIRYNDALLTVYQQVTFTWMRQGSSRTHETTFFLVSPNLIDPDLVLGDLDPESTLLHLNNCQYPYFSPWGVEANTDSYSLVRASVSPLHNDPRMAHPFPQRESQHGPRFQGIDPTQSIADSSLYESQDAMSSHPDTVVPMSRRPSANQSVSGLGQRLRPTTLDMSNASNSRQSPNSSRIPRRQASSGSSSGSPNIDPSRVSGRTAFDSSPRTPLRNQSSPTAESTPVTLVWNGSQIAAKLELNAPGESFFLSLQRPLRRIKCSLDRDLHYARFSTEKGVTAAASCVVSLVEEEVSDEWEQAVDWIKSKRGSTPRGIFVMIEQDEG
ncbi:hypothetical protein NA57DRAFT_59046 [Rhizodiscina lignyota]|uniref:Uncharacterized protein n=1 Tax=Rhizodiscina lignyota TaxID=1504668 RepID=A0A9P4IB29_9PEZI|nr:hypothetical protein NA57DRAFT_59046 [Rhizodiscina lignyota]